MGKQNTAQTAEQTAEPAKLVRATHCANPKEPSEKETPMRHVTLTDQDTGEQYTFSDESIEDLASRVEAALDGVTTDRARVTDEAGFTRGWLDSSGDWRAA